MLQSQLIDLVFTGGADTKTDDKNKIFTNFSELKNVRTDLLSAVRPRGTFAQYAIASEKEANVLSVGFGAVSSDRHNVQLAHGASWRVQPGDGFNPDKEIVAGSEVRGSARRRIYGESPSAIISTATSFNRVCTVWRDDTNLYVNLETPDGTQILQSSFLAVTGQAPLVVLNMSNTFVILYEDSGILKGRYIIERESDVSVPLTFASGPPAILTAQWDAFSDGIELYISTHTSINHYQIGLPTLTLINTVASPAEAMTRLSLFTNGAYLAAVGSTGPTTNYLKFYSASLVQVGATVTTSQTQGTAWVVQENSTSVTYGFTTVQANGRSWKHSHVYHNAQTAVTTVGTPSILGARLAGRPFYVDKRLLVFTDTYTVPTYGSQALLEILRSESFTDPGLLLGVSKNFGDAVGLSGIGYRNLRAPSVIGSRIYVPAPMVGSSYAAPLPAALNIATNRIVSVIQATNLVIDLNEYSGKLIDSSKNQSLVIGSVPRYAGAYRQLGTPWPEIHMDTTNNLTVVAGASSGTMSLVFAKVIALPDGSIYRTYGPIFVANLSAQAYDYSLDTSDFTIAAAPGSAVTTIEVYRTTLNGTIFYLDATWSTAQTNKGPQVTDAQLITKRLADVNANELYSEPAGAVRTIVQWKDRLAAVMVDRGTVIKFNKPSIAPQGTVFADGLELDVGTDGGDIEALAAMDASLYIFKRNSILTTAGDPPGPTGENGNLNTPTVLRNGLGTLDPRSVILTPRGIMFNSQKGFYMIQRNQEWSFIGEGPYADRTIKITGAAVDEKQAEIYFTYETGLIWVYNYESGQWYEWNPPGTMKGATVHKGVLFISSDNGYGVYDPIGQVDTVSGSANTPVPQECTTGWLKPGHIRGFQRVRRLYIAARALAACKVTVSVYVDYQATPVQIFEHDVTAADPVQFDLHLATQKCEAMRFSIQTDKFGLIFSGATLEVGVKQGPDKSRTTNLAG